MRNLIFATAALLASSAPAHAGTTFDSTMIGQAVIFNFNGFNTPDGSGGAIPGLAAVATLKLTSVTTGAFNFDFAIDNVSTIASRVSVFGFDTSPDILSASVSSAVFPKVKLDGNVPNLSGTNSFRTCFSGQNCSGGGNAGVFPADLPATGSFVLRVANSVNSLTIDRAFVRYQSVATFGSATGSGVVTAVPEPATWAMMIGGFGLVGAVARRRARARRPAIA